MKERNLDRLALWGTALAVLFTIVLIVGSILFATPVLPSDKTNFITTGYEDKIFDRSIVHRIDIQIPQVNWDYMVEKATDEQYVLCTVIIDGETIENVAIRPKGNSSLKAIKTQGSDRFSFKIEFDHYRDDITYHGLDKLALNNLGQDVSCMKDFLAYQMMNEVGIPAPLSSYAVVTLNGEDFGLYLAVEAIEDSFAYRNYGTAYGNIYKPECFMIDKVTPSAFKDTVMDPEILSTDYTVLGPGDRFDILGTFARIPFETAFGEDMEVAAFHYVGDDEARYSVFFDSAVFDLKKEDKTSFIDALKTLNSDSYRDAIDESSLIRYFLVHNLLNNYDGYTGIFVHNYYVREKDGKLSLIPWDYNLSCGIFTMESAIKSFLGLDSAYLPDLQIGEAMDDGTSYVNYPIDTPTFTVETEDRPLLSAVLNDPELLSEYHEEFSRFLDSFFASGEFEELFQHTREILDPYIQEGLTFYTTEQVNTAMDTIHDYFLLREESIRRQLEGTLPATKEGQREDYGNLVDGSGLDLSTSVTFDSLVFGIGSEDVYSVLDSIAGDHSRDTQGLSEAIEEMMEEPKQILKAVGRIISSTRVIRNALESAVTGPILLILSIILLCIVRKKTIHFQRKNQVKRKEENQ